MRAHDAPAKQGVAILPLALVLVLHLMLVLLWAGAGRRQFDQGAEQRHFTLTWLPALTPKKPPVPPRARQAPAPVARPRAAPAPGAVRLAPTAPADTVAVEVEMAQQSPAPDAPDVQQMIATAKRQAGLADNALREGKLAPLTPDPELPVNRLRRALESAHIDRSRVMVMDMQTQPDGVIVYRFRRGGKVWCRQSGGGGPGGIAYSEGAKLAGAGSLGGGAAAGNVACPSGESGWSRR